MSKNLFLALLAFVIFSCLTLAFYFLSWRKPASPKMGELFLQDPGTVIFSDDFEGDLSGWTVTGDGNSKALIQSEQLKSGAKSLKLVNDGVNAATVTRTFSQPEQGNISVWFYDNNSSSAGYFLHASDDQNRQVMVGVKTSSYANQYYYRTNTTLTNGLNTRLTRFPGWHQLEIVVTPKGSYGKIDGQNLSVLPNTTSDVAIRPAMTGFTKIGLATTWRHAGSAYFDNLAVTSLIPPGPKLELAETFLDTFLKSYNTLNLAQMDQLLKSRQSSFSQSDMWKFHLEVNHVQWALAYTGKVYAYRYLATGDETYFNKALEILRYLDGQYDPWWKPGYDGFLNTSPKVLELARLIWDRLDPALRDSVETHIVAQANYAKTAFSPYSSYSGDSSGENNLPGATIPHRFSDLLPYRPEVDSWLEKTKFFAFHSLTRGESYGGWTSRTIYDNYLFDNHNYHPHPLYALGVVGGLSSLANRYKIQTGSIPPEYTHNVLEVWRAHKPYIDFRSFRVKGNKLQMVGGSTPNKFVPSGLDDWGNDALKFNAYDTLRDVFGENSVNDPETGFSTTDLAQHAFEFTHYIRRGGLFAFEKPNVQFTEMLVDHGNPSPETMIGQRASYRWMQNSLKVAEYVDYLIGNNPRLGYACTFGGATNRHNTSPWAGNGDPRFMCWKGRFYFCGLTNEWQNQGVLTASADDQRGKWQCNGEKWLDTTAPNPSPSLSPSPSSQPSPPAYCRYDYNGNHSLEVGDILYVLSHWGALGAGEITAVLAHWGGNCNL